MTLGIWQDVEVHLESKGCKNVYYYTLFTFNCVDNYSLLFWYLKENYELLLSGQIQRNL